MLPTQELPAKYVYGITKADGDRPLPVEGVGEQAPPVHTVETKDIAAIVSDIQSTPVRGNRRNLMAHSRVLEASFKRDTVLPMRFGVVLPDDDAVRNSLLEPRYEAWREMLDRMEGLGELTLKAIYYEERILREILEEDPSIRAMRNRSRNATGDRAYLDRVALGEMVAERLQAKGESEGAALLERLQRFAVDVRANPPTVERMLLNAAFLVRRDRIETFDEVMQEIGAHVAERMHFKYVGPLPPYSFVEVDLEQVA